MTPQPQQILSCDTCNHAQKSDAREYPVKCSISKPIPMYVHKYCVSWFGYVGCASHSSRPAPAADTLEQTAIEELLAIEGYVNGIYSGDESQKRMCEHISTSIGVIRNAIKERESIRREVQE